MTRRIELTVVLAAVALVLGAALAIAGGSSRKVQLRRDESKLRPLASPDYVAGLGQHRFQVGTVALKKWLAGPTPPILVDVRGKAAFEAGHIAGALLRPAAKLLSGEVTLQATGRQVVIYCQDGRLTPYLLHPLRSQGLDVYQLAGGYAAWASPDAAKAAERQAAGQKTTGHAPAMPAPPPTETPPAGLAAPPPPMAPPAGGPAPAAGGAPVKEGC
jgi:rhodanese-related sulfurtransferase